MKEIYLPAGTSIEKAVEQLLIYKKQGKHVYTDFNGTKLYSDNVTVDSAYLEITGKTKIQWEEDRKKDRERDRIRDEENQKRAIENIPSQIERGKKLIYPFRHEEWVKFVNACANSMWQGVITENVIEIMTAIDEERHIKEILRIFKNQGHSGMSYSLTRNYVMLFSKNGYPFYKETHYGEWTKQECYDIKQTLKENYENSKELRIASSSLKSEKDISRKLLRLNKKDN